MPSTPRIIAAAALMGLAAGAVAVYVTAGPDGNTAGPAAIEVAETDAVCAARTERAQVLGEAATGQVAAMLPADPPQSLKSLSFNGPSGEPTTIGAFGDKTLLVNLWATWCAPCREEMPALDQLQAEMGGENFEVVAINIDTGSDEKPQKFLTEIGVENLAYYRDASMDVFNDLKKRGLALGLPVTVLVDEEGCLLAHMNGPADWASDDAVRWIGMAIREEG